MTVGAVHNVDVDFLVFLQWRSTPAPPRPPTFPLQHPSSHSLIIAQTIRMGGIIIRQRTSLTLPATTSTQVQKSSAAPYFHPGVYDDDSIKCYFSLLRVRAHFLTRNYVYLYRFSALTEPEKMLSAAQILSFFARHYKFPAAD